MAFWGWLIPKREKPICVKCRWHRRTEHNDTRDAAAHGCKCEGNMSQCRPVNFVTGFRRGYTYCDIFNDHGQCRHFKRREGRNPHEPVDSWPEPTPIPTQSPGLDGWFGPKGDEQKSYGENPPYPHEHLPEPPPQPKGDD